MLNGIIDSPDIPLNVSRSYLQSDSNVRKITSYITKKVAEKLNDLFKNNREDYELKWDDIGTFIKYGIISDSKFEDKAMGFALLKNTDKKYYTVEEYKEQVKALQTDKTDKITALYTQDVQQQYSLIQQCKERSYQVLVFDNVIDNHFIQHLEYKADLKFKRIDSDTIDLLIEKDEKNESVLSEKDQNTIKDLFVKLANNKSTDIQVKALSPSDDPIQIIRPEFMRRMGEMQHMMTMMKGDGNDLFKDSYSIVINSNNPIIVKKLNEQKNKAEKSEMANYLLQLALLNQNMLKGEELSTFIKKSMEKI